MRLLAVVTPTSIYHGYSTWKTFWEDKFIPANMRSCGRCNVRKHKEIKNGDQYITLDIYLELGCLNKRKATSSGPRDYVVISGKGRHYIWNAQGCNNPLHVGNTRIMVEVQDIASDPVKKGIISYSIANHHKIHPLTSEDSVRIYSDK